MSLNKQLVIFVLQLFNNPVETQQTKWLLLLITPKSTLKNDPWMDHTNLSMSDWSAEHTQNMEKKIKTTVWWNHGQIGIRPRTVPQAANTRLYNPSYDSVLETPWNVIFTHFKRLRCCRWVGGCSALKLSGCGAKNAEHIWAFWSHILMLALWLCGIRLNNWFCRECCLKAIRHVCNTLLLLIRPRWQNELIEQKRS